MQSLVLRRKNSTNVRPGGHGMPPSPRLLGLLSRLAPPLAAAAAEPIFLATRRFPAPEPERELLAEGVAGWVRSGSRTLRCWRWGRLSSPAVLLVHGWNGRGGQLGALVSPLLAAGYRVVTFDASGHGHSDGHSSSMPRLATEIEAVAAAHGPLHGIVAHSLGGLSTVMALARGLHARRAVLIAAPAYPRKWFDQMAERLALSSRARARLLRRFRRRFGHGFDELAGPRLSRHLGTSALLIHDRDDREVPPSASHEIASAWPGAQLLLTRGLGHRRILTDPATIESVVRFIDGDLGRLQRSAPDDHRPRPTTATDAAPIVAAL